jgi:hypothetical protein
VTERLVHLGLGRYVRADRVTAIVPIEEGERGPGRRTRVFVEGMAEPLIASRSSAAIAGDLGLGSPGTPPQLAQPEPRSSGSRPAREQDALF